MSRAVRAETEAQFASWFEDLLDLKGWRWAHFRPAQTKHGWRTAVSGYQGFPDYCCVKGSRVVFVELKAEGGKTTPEQLDWLHAFRDAGVEAYIYRPRAREDIMERFAEPASRVSAVVPVKEAPPVRSRERTAGKNKADASQLEDNTTLTEKCPCCKGNGRVEMLDHCPCCSGSGYVSRVGAGHGGEYTE